MPVQKKSGRQQVISAIVDFTYADVAVDGTLHDLIDIPVNAVVVGGDLVVDTAWNNLTTATLTVGDATTNNRYLTATSLKTPGRTALVPTGFKHTSSEPSIRGAGVMSGTAATAGAARLRVDYVVMGRSQFATGKGL